MQLSLCKLPKAINLFIAVSILNREHVSPPVGQQWLFAQRAADAPFPPLQSKAAASRVNRPQVSTY